MEGATRAPDRNGEPGRQAIAKLLPRLRQEHAIDFAVVNVEPLRSQLDEFVRVMRTGERPYVDGEDGLWAVAVANALLTAAAERRPVEVTTFRGEGA